MHNLASTGYIKQPLHLNCIVIILKNCNLFLSDPRDLSNLPIVKKPIQNSPVQYIKVQTRKRARIRPDEDNFM